MCGGGNNITVFKGAVEFLSSNETTGVGNVSHEPGAFARGDFLQFGVVPVARVGRSTADDETGLKDFRLRGEANIVYQVGLWGDGIRKRLEVDGRGGHFLLSSLEVKSREKFIVLEEASNNPRSNHE